MTALFSQHWHRVADIKPRLTPGFRLRRQRVRGERWYLLDDADSGRSVRLNAAGYAFAGRLDGARTTQQLWDALLEQPGDPATQDELIEVLVRLHEAGLLQTDQSGSFFRPPPVRDPPRGGRSLMAWRIPLADPSPLLDRLGFLQEAIFSRTALAVWIVAMIVLAALAFQHAAELYANGRLWLATPRFGALALALYVPIKVLHELAHGLAVRRWGGQVREAGITLMMGMPVPYVDASACAGFVHRRERIVVGAAGIMAELALAAVALPLWLWLDGGPLRDAVFVTLFITGVSSLLFNANPLQRLDGYYVLADALELPNLASRSRQWWSDALLRRVLRVPGIESLPMAPGEAKWLFAYAPLSWLYGLLMMCLAVSWLGQLSLPLALGCAAILAWQMLLMPPLRMLRQLRGAALRQAVTARRWRLVLSGAAALLIVAMLLPLPRRTVVQGVVWPADQAQLRAGEDGFIESIEIGDGAAVQAGQVVLRLRNPRLQADLERQRARISALETESLQTVDRAAASVGDTRAGDSRAELAAAQAEFAQLTERIQALDLHTGAAGRIAIPNRADLAGQFVHRGQLLGWVLTDQPAIVRAALPEAELSDLRRARGAVSVRLAGSPGQAHAAELLNDGGGAVFELPSAALSARNGGSVLTDPRDAKDLQPMVPVVLLDVRLDGAAGAAAQRPGERAWVRFDAGFAPLAVQAAQALARRFQRQFGQHG